MEPRSDGNRDCHIGVVPPKPAISGRRAGTHTPRPIERARLHSPSKTGVNALMSARSADRLRSTHPTAPRRIARRTEPGSMGVLPRQISCHGRHPETSEAPAEAQANATRQRRQLSRRCQNTHRASAPLPKFVIHCGTLLHELRKQRGTSNFMILVPLFDLKFLNELAAEGVGTSNRRR